MSPSVPELLVLSSPDERARLTGACLAVLAYEAGCRVRRGTLGDVARLLAPDADEPPRTWIVLGSGSIPREDVGILRRFLEAEPLRRVCVVAEPEGADDRYASLERRLEIPWPCDLDRLAGFLAAAGLPPAEAPGEAAPPMRAALEAPEPEPFAVPEPEPSVAPEPASHVAPPEPASRAPRHAAPPPAAAHPLEPARVPAEPAPELDVKALLEELATDAALSEPSAIRYRFEGPDEVRIAGPRLELRDSLARLLEVARALTGGGGWIEIRVEATPSGGALTTLTFTEAGGPGAAPTPPLGEPLEVALAPGLAPPVLERAGPGRLRLELRLGERAAAARVARS